jgi:antitoxin (DNA-binding transcriptional repressor) of toxin-antitoxin stability system
MTMFKVNIADLKAKLSDYLDAVSRGEQVVICNRNVPVAELRAIAAPRTGPRDLSPMFPGATFMTDAFFEPMTEDEVEQWYGPDVVPARVAEPPASYGKPASPARKRKPRS